MLGWIFRKLGGAAATTPAPAQGGRTAPAAPTARKAAAAPAPTAPAPAPKAPAVDWAARLAQASGNDDALLALLQTAAVPLQFKQAAVEALDSEAALAAAERACRNNDRRVHQLAKRRLQAKVAQRQTRAQAAQLIASAHRLAAEPDMPVNRSVELDRAWQALDAAAIAPEQRDEFAALTAQLATSLQQRTDNERQHKRWLADAVQAARQLHAANTDAAAGAGDPAALAAVAGTARTVAQATPETLATAALQAASADLQRALRNAEALDAHLAALERLLASPAGDGAAAGADESPTAWQALPPLPDAALQAQLQARHARFQQAASQALQQAQEQARDQARETQRAQRRQQQGERAAARQIDHETLAAHTAQAEAALDAGQLADAQRLLGDIDAALHGADAPDALQPRIAAAQARLAQLRGWQHWAGGRAREDLVLQAEALAVATLNTTAAASVDAVEAADAVDAVDATNPADASDGDGIAAATAAPAPTSAADADVARLSVRQRADVIATLRARWKEIDRAGGASGRALWQRFDAALKTANAPVAAFAAQQRAARDANLAARVQLLDTLEALQAGSDGPSDASTEPTAAQPAASAQDLAAALAQFQTGWRKLGPLEHTVPRAAQAAVAARMEAAVQRVEAPLRAVRQQARAEREALVAQARALAGDGVVRDLVAEVRALQADWQQHARAVPLSRGDEQALWTAFKAAIDAAFAARDAVFSARDAELETHAAERMALIARLQVDPADSTAAQRRTLADVDAAWQRCGPAPRARADALENSYRRARGALQQWLDDAAQRAWQAGCDTLDAKLALCLSHEQPQEQDGAGTPPEAIATRWQALPTLPAPLEDALRRRAGLDPAAPAPAIDADALLLQLETAWDLPTPPAFEAERRNRKLLAMKAALEGRRAAADDSLPPAQALSLLVGHAGLDAGQRSRLDAVLAARRRRGPPGDPAPHGTSR